MTSTRHSRLRSWLRDQLGRLRTRLLLVNLIVVLVPAVGLEFARIYERQLLNALERDMHNQAVIVREVLTQTLDDGGTLASDHHETLLRRAAKSTRTRIRVLDGRGLVIGDSHRYGPPEGREPPAPSMLPELVPDIASPPLARYSWSGGRWQDIADRHEVRSALAGNPDNYTRVRGSDPAVLLFHALPVRRGGAVVGVVYVTRSTRPVMVELYRIRSGLLKVLAVALCFTALMTILLAWSISRPLSKLARAARQIAEGSSQVEVPIGGSGEVRQLGIAFATMTRKLDERLRYITDFTADVTHELKSPLTSIRGAAELLSEGAADEPEARERFLRNIQLDVDRLDRLVSRLLELSRIEATTEPMTQMDLAAVVERVIERTHTPEQPVIWAGRPDPAVESEINTISWRGREADIERALLNLVENALRFSPANEPVRITVEITADELQMAVHDRGPGVPSAERERIFERFYTTDAERSGTGLGLAIVTGVARGHGGNVTLHSCEGEGSTFTMHLPRQSPARKR